MAMQYPPAAMVMQQHHHNPQMVQQQHYATPPLPQMPHYVAYPQYQVPPYPRVQQGSGGGAGEENRSIWVGDLHPWMDETYLRSCFATAGEVISISLFLSE